MSQPGEIALFVEYTCPYCQAALENHAGPSTPWVRCPQCGRASRPPVEGSRAQAVNDEPLYVPKPAPVRHAPRDARPANPWRVAFAAGVFVSVVMLLFAFLDGSTGGVTLFSTTAIVSLGLLIHSAR